jgi:hypothetical protein
MKFKKVDLSEINLQEQTFRYTLKPVDERLLFSVQQAGIVEPVVVKKEGKGYIPVTGFRRLEAAGKLGFSQVPVIELEEKTSRLEAFLTAFFDNFGWRVFSLAEKSLAVKKFLEFGMEKAEIIRKVLVWLELPPNGRTLEILSQLAEEESLLPIIHEKNWKLSTAERLLEFNQEERSQLVNLVSGLSLNRQAEIIEGFCILKKRWGKTLAEILKETEFQEILAQKNLDKVQAGEKLAEKLREKTSSLVTRLLKQIDREIMELNLSPPLTVDYDRTLEDRHLTLKLKLSSVEELKNIIRELSSQERESHWQRIFALLRTLEE